MIYEDYINERKTIWEKSRSITQDREWRQLAWYEFVKSKENVERLFKCPWLLIEFQFTIKDKNFTETPFFLNDVQKDFLNRILVPAIEKQKKGEIKQIKLRILKGRQQGFTSFITAFMLCSVLIDKGFNGFTMSHVHDSARDIFDRLAKRYLNSLVEPIREEPKKSNARELVFDKKDTSWKIGTAGGKDTGRGNTLKMLHNSEKAFWDKPRETAASLSQALAPVSIEIDETTANGYNEFKEDWDEAENGHSIWQNVFYQWYKSKEYRQDFQSGLYSQDEFMEAVMKCERFYGVDSKFMALLKSLYTEIGLDVEQIHWYFMKRKELKEKVYQEYPCTAKQAFLFSGRAYFDVELIDILINELKKPPKYLQNGEIEIFEIPQTGIVYVMASDVAEGLDTGDKSTFDIIRMDTLEQVACGEYKATPDEHAYTLDKIGRMYNYAFLGVERNNHGHSTLNTLVNVLKYRNLFKEQEIGKTRNKTTDKWGWLTTAKSKFIMLDELDTAIREEAIKINSKKSLEQLREVQVEDGKVNINGKDRVASLAIAWQMVKLKPKPGTISRKPQGF